MQKHAGATRLVQILVSWLCVTARWRRVVGHIEAADFTQSR